MHRKLLLLPILDIKMLLELFQQLVESGIMPSKISSFFVVHQHH